MSETDTSADVGSAVNNGSAARPAAPRTGSGSAGPTPSNKLTRRGRLRKWDRPPSPHDWRWYVGGLGKLLIAVGLLMFGFVGYQLYGTGIQTAAAQNRLENEFEELLAESTTVDPPPIEVAPTVPEPDPDPVAEPAPSTTVAAEPAVEAVPVENQNLVQVENGDALARIEIPEIGVDDIVVAGVDKGDLQKGPGHFPDTPLPGQLGNSAIAGHRTTYGQPFRNVDQLEPGDRIRVTTLSGTFVYRVTGTTIVSPSYYQAVATTDPTVANLTLTSCHPVFTARERIVIASELVVEESAPVGEPILNYGRAPDPAPADETTATTPAPSTAVANTADVSSDVPVTDAPASSVPDADDDPTFAQTPADTGTGTGTGTDQLGTDAVNAGIADAFSESWFSDPGANAHVGLWGLALSAIALGAYWVSRRLRHDWAGLLIGIVPFTVALYFFFQNVNRLLPPNL